MTVQSDGSVISESPRGTAASGHPTVTSVVGHEKRRRAIGVAHETRRNFNMSVLPAVVRASLWTSVFLLVSLEPLHHGENVC